MATLAALPVVSGNPGGLGALLISGMGLPTGVGLG